jgi:hypothetical protein
VTFCADMSVAEPLVDADAPPASDKDTPASPNTRRVFLRRFRFEANFAAAILNPSICRVADGATVRRGAGHRGPSHSLNDRSEALVPIPRSTPKWQQDGPPAARGRGRSRAR